MELCLLIKKNVYIPCGPSITDCPETHRKPAAGFRQVFCKDNITGNSSPTVTYLIVFSSKKVGITSDFVYLPKTCRGGFPEVSGQSIIDGPHGTSILLKSSCRKTWLFRLLYIYLKNKIIPEYHEHIAYCMAFRWQMKDTLDGAYESTSFWQVELSL